jgi:hypothetical protein
MSLILKETGRNGWESTLQPKNTKRGAKSDEFTWEAEYPTAIGMASQRACP